MGMTLLSHMLTKFVQKGTLHVIEADGRLHEFKGTPEPLATIEFHEDDLPFKIFRNPELHLGEGYMNGTVTLVDCTISDFLGLFSLNRG